MSSGRLKTWVRDLIVGILRATLGIFGTRFRYKVSRLVGEALYPPSLAQELVDIAVKKGSIRFYCLGELAAWRARTLLEKEPETIEWIEGFRSEEVFWDVGANVGVYTLYAAIAQGVRVLSFEPSAPNYFLLNRNIEANCASDRVRAYCLAFAETTSLDVLHMQDTRLGGALNSFGEPVDHLGKAFAPKFLQGMMGFSIDDFISRYSPAFPNHLKIDVDGIEDKIILGAARTLSDNRLFSLSVELDDSRADYTKGVTAAIERAGLRLHSKRHAAMYDGTKVGSIYNFRFVRENRHSA